MEMQRVELDFTVGIQIDFTNGNLVPNTKDSLTTEFFYPVSRGDFIECLDKNYAFAVAFFRAEREETYVYTYAYKTDSAWVTYDGELSRAAYTMERYEVLMDGYCRITMRKIDGSALDGTEAEHGFTILRFCAKKKLFSPKACFADEIADTAKKVMKIWDTKKIPQKASLVSFALLTDSHYTVNGTFEDTADNISKVLTLLQEGISAQKGKKLQGILHLGDFTDGMTSKKVTAAYVTRMLKMLSVNGLPLYIVHGNHDFNYFRGNKDYFSLGELNQFVSLEKEYYFKDFPQSRLRCFFLFSYDITTPVRYGFSEEEVDWVKKTLETTPSGWKVLIFSHEAPLDRLDYWARLIRNGHRLLEVLEAYQAREDAQILAYIHGHTHAEYLYRGASFPILSIGSNKCEYFTEKKPKGSHTWERQLGTVTQDLWDVLTIDTNAQKLYFTRFGAGEDRVVDCAKTVSTWKMEEQQKKSRRKTKIWAHRGASSFAPENTLPAFEIAKELWVDGIQLDVQMTKDGELVVIHDETIDRTSNGSGRVRELTLAQLRAYNYNFGQACYGFVKIPTLREVYALFQGTDFTINVWLSAELKDRVQELTVKMGMEKQVVYSIDPHTLLGKKQYYVTRDKTAFAFGDDMREAVLLGKEKEIRALQPKLENPALEMLIQTAHENGRKVQVWTVNEKEDALRLYKLGVDAILTDRPGKMRELFEEIECIKGET